MCKIKYCQRHNVSEGWVHIITSTKILIKLQLRNLDEALTLKSQPYINILTKPSFIILTKIQLRNLSQAAKYWPNFSFKNFAWTSTSNSWPNLVIKVWTKFSFMTKLQLPKLHKTVVKTFLIINISNSNKLNKFWVGIFTSHTSHQSSLLNRSELVSESTIILFLFVRGPLFVK